MKKLLGLSKKEKETEAPPPPPPVRAPSGNSGMSAPPPPMPTGSNRSLNSSADDAHDTSSSAPGDDFPPRKVLEAKLREFYMDHEPKKVLELEKIIGAAQKNGIKWLQDGLARKYNGATIDFSAQPAKKPISPPRHPPVPTFDHQPSEDLQDAREEEGAGGRVSPPPAKPHFQPPVGGMFIGQPPPQFATAAAPGIVTYPNAATALKSKGLGKYVKQLEERGIVAFEDLAKIEEDPTDVLWATMPPLPDKKQMRILIQSVKDYVAQQEGGDEAGGAADEAAAASASGSTPFDDHPELVEQHAPQPGAFVLPPPQPPKQPPPPPKPAAPPRRPSAVAAAVPVLPPRDEEHIDEVVDEDEVFEEDQEEEPTRVLEQDEIQSYGEEEDAAAAADAEAEAEAAAAAEEEAAAREREEEEARRREEEERAAEEARKEAVRRKKEQEEKRRMEEEVSRRKQATAASAVAKPPPPPLKRVDSDGTRELEEAERVVQSLKLEMEEQTTKCDEITTRWERLAKELDEAQAQAEREKESLDAITTKFADAKSKLETLRQAHQARKEKIAAVIVDEPTEAMEKATSPTAASSAALPRIPSSEAVRRSSATGIPPLGRAPSNEKLLTRTGSSNRSFESEAQQTPAPALTRTGSSQRNLEVRRSTDLQHNDDSTSSEQEPAPVASEPGVSLNPGEIAQEATQTKLRSTAVAATRQKTETPCDHFELDMRASAFGMCVCGHPKTEHKQLNTSGSGRGPAFLAREPSNKFKHLEKPKSPANESKQQVEEKPAPAKPAAPASSPKANLDKDEIVRVNNGQYPALEPCESFEQDPNKPNLCICGHQKQYHQQASPRAAAPPPDKKPVPPARRPSLQAKSASLGEQRIEKTLAETSEAPELTEGEKNRAKLVEFYTKYNPEKVKEVDTILEKFKGKEAVMFKKLKEKYPEADL